MTHLRSALFLGAILAGLALLVLSGPVSAKSCPPGLAKKTVRCIPPGLIEKRFRRDEAGDYLEGKDYHLVRYRERYGLPPPGPGEGYVIVNNQIYLVRADTLQILSVLNAVAAILD